MSCRVLRIGLTGGIGAGKSYVARILQAMGYPVFHSDSAAKTILDHDKQLHVFLQQLFGKEIMQNGFPNKEKLAKLIFNDNDNREKVNALIHPRVREQFDLFCANLTDGMVFNEAAILFETGAYLNLDATVLVCAPEMLRLKRIIERDRCNTELAQAKMASQWSDEMKIPLSDYHIINDDETPLLAQVEKVVANIENELVSKNEA